jgi:hypothetical protein
MNPKDILWEEEKENPQEEDILIPLGNSLRVKNPYTS